MTNKNISNSYRHNKSKKKSHRAYKIFFGTLVSNSRLKIINLLRNGKKNVSQIVKELKANQTAVSHDLARLKKCGFVQVESDKKYRYYSLNEKTIKPLMGLIDRHMNRYCIHILKEIKRHRKQ